MCDVIGSIDEDTMLYFTYNPFFGINDVDDNDYLQFTVVMSNGTVWLNVSDSVNITANTNFSTQGTTIFVHNAYIPQEAVTGNLSQ